MNISGISSSSYTNPFAKIKEDFKDIGTALQSGSLSDAQDAYATLQTDTTSESSDSNNPLAKDIESLGSALDSGNLDDAQQVLSKIEQHLKGHGEFAKQQMDIAANLEASSGTATTSTSSGNTLQDDFKTLSDALSSGNLSDAQTALASIQKQVSAHNGGQSDDPFSQDLQSLSDALQSGSLSDAQDVFSQIQDKMASAPQGPPPGPPPGEGQNGQTGQNASEDSVTKTLQALLDALNETSSSTSTTSSSDSTTSSTDDPITTLKALLTSALKSYQQMSSSQYGEDAANSTGTVLSSSV